MSLDIISKSLDKFEGTLSSVKTQQAEFADRLLSLEQGGAIKSMNHGNASAQSVGAQVAVKFAENADLFSKTKSLRMEVKAASDVVTSASGRYIVSGGVGSPTGLPYGVQNGLRITPAAGVSAVEYFRYGGVEGAAGVQASRTASGGTRRTSSGAAPTTTGSSACGPPDSPTTN